MFTIISFFTSAVILTAFVALKRFEIKTGKLLAPDFRLRMDNLAVKSAKYFKYEFPVVFKNTLTKIVLYMAHFSSTTLLNGVRYVERKLHKFVDTIRGKKEISSNGTTPSSYFKDVKEHKEKSSRNREEDVVS